jgi:hypothetical protein
MLASQPTTPPTINQTRIPIPPSSKVACGSRGQNERRKSLVPRRFP